MQKLGVVVPTRRIFVPNMAPAQIRVFDQYVKIPFRSWWLDQKLKHGWMKRGRNGPPGGNDGRRPVHGGAKHGALHLHTSGEWEHRNADGEVLGRGEMNPDNLIVDDGVEFIVDCWQNLEEMEDMKYHAFGDDNTAPAVGQAALISEVETRDAGTTAENAANIFETVGTHSFAGGHTIEEWGLFDQLALGGTMFERDLTGSIVVVATDQITMTYRVTFTAGG